MPYTQLSFQKTRSIVAVAALLLACNAVFAQATYTKDLALFIDTTLQTDVPLAVLSSELPVTVSAGTRWKGKFRVMNVSREAIHSTFKVRLIYENRDTYHQFAQEIGTWEGSQLLPQVPVEQSFEALAPAGLPTGSTKLRIVVMAGDNPQPLSLAMKYHHPPGFYEVGKINMLNNGSRKKKRMVFFGDSITQEATMPDGYVSQLEKMGGKAAAYELIGAGVGGDRVTSLWARADADVLVYKPAVVVIFVGVNDCGWFRYVPHIGGTQLDQYERVLTDLVKKFQREKIKVVVCTPAALGEKKNGENEEDQNLDQYVEVCRKVAKAQGCKLVDLRLVFTEYEQKNNPQNLSKGILTTDGVHLTPLGGKLVAENILKVL
jgi:lysophospholipase L1-like esterase